MQTDRGLSPDQTQFRQSHLASKMGELWKQIELLLHMLNAFAALLDSRRIQIAELGCHLKVADSGGVNLHQAAAGCVGCDRVVRKHEATERLHATV